MIVSSCISIENTSYFVCKIESGVISLNDVVYLYPRNLKTYIKEILDSNYNEINHA